MSMEIRAMFKAKQAPEPKQGERDAISLFRRSIDTQIAKLDAIAKDKSTKIATTNWFKAVNGGYRLHLGKKPIELDGAKYWQVADVDEARALFEGAKDLAASDRDFQDAIRAAKKAEDDKGKTTDEPVRKKPGRKPKSA